MKTRVRELAEQGNRLFATRMPIVSLWQQIAEQFYVERADFTVQRSIGMEFASHLMTGVPSMCRRDLANQIGALLRPRGQPWFHARTPIEQLNRDPTSRQWLDWASEHMRLYMYDTRSGFIRATREGDHDFSAFGQAVITVELNQTLNGLLFRCWHLKDVAWSENFHYEIDRVHRKWKPTARMLTQLFQGSVSPKITDLNAKNPFQEVECQHIVIPASDYDLARSKNSRKLPYVSIYIDVQNEAILEEVPAYDNPYIIPRWQTVAGSQYAYSPATVIALSDARMLQQMTLTMIEAGQKAVDPPMLAAGEVIQGGINMFAGGITYVDSEYDERTGEALRPIPLDRSGLSWGDNREQKVREIIMEAFYLNQIQLPELKGDMTAFETQKRVEEYIRRALPLFEPMETEYNGALCDKTFDILLRNGAFGSADNIPPSLAGQDVRFTFESPLQAAQTRANSQAFMQTAQLLSIAAQIDPMVKHDIDVDRSFRDAAEGAGAPAAWFVDEQVANQKKAQDAQQQAQQAAQAQQMAMLQQGAVAADSAGSAAKNFNQAMTPAQ
jgi:hypothetical protein